MAARLRLPVHDLRALSAAEVALLREVAAEGSSALERAMADPGARATMQGVATFLFRRWVLEVLLLLRARGPLAYNAISRALGRIAGESLAPKLQQLERAGIIERATTGAPPRARYRLTAAGAPLASGVLALTTFKREHARVVADPTLARDLVSPPEPRAGANAATFARAVEAFAASHLARGGAASGEEELRIARRFSEACVRRWHGEVLSTLVTRGPMRYSDLRAALGAGDQALANALAALSRLESVERVGGAWRATSLGRLDVAVGGALLLLVPRSTPQDRLHAV